MAQLNISLPREDLSIIRSEAQDRGLTVSQYVRGKVLDKQSWGPWGEGGSDLRGQLEAHETRLAKLERVANLD